MRYGILLLTICPFLWGASVNGQVDYSFRHITQLDGLINNRVFTIAQDRRGFIWIGTDNGLQRYDGSRFISYQGELNPGNKSAITIGNIDVMHSSRLFLSQNKKLDPYTNVISSYDKKAILKEVEDPRNIYEDKEHTIWITGSRYTYACSSGIIHTYNCARDTLRRQVWVATDLGLVLLDGRTREVYSHSFNPLHFPLLEPAVLPGPKGVMLDSRNNLWVNSWTSRFYRYNFLSRQLTRYSLASIGRDRHVKSTDWPMLVHDIFEDNHQQVWLATANAGLLQYLPGTDSFHRIVSKQGYSRGIQYNYEIFCIFQDRDDNIWLGTDRGINIFTPYHQYFTAIRSRDTSRNTLPKREIISVTQTRNGDILVGTWGGGFAVYTSRWEYKRTISFTGAFENNLLWCFAETDDGMIWAGCQHGYIHIYDPSTSAVSTLHPDAMLNSTIRCMKKDPEGNLLFGLHNGRVAVWNKKQGQFHAYDEDSPQVAGSFTPIHNIYIDRKAQCWISTENGLKLFDEEKKKFTAVYYPGDNKPNTFEGIEEDNDSILLTGIVNGGIACFNKNSKTFSFPSVAAGLSSSTVHAIQKDGVGNVWVTTDYNLYKFRLPQNKYVSFKTEPGLINSDFQSTSFYRLRGGAWASVTSTEVICFCPDTLSSKSEPLLPVEITGLKVLDKPVFVDSFLTKKEPIRLGNNENFLTIEFAMLSFSNIRQVKYFYRLSGVDRDWKSAGVTGAANYTNLAPGDYTFEVIADNEGRKGPSATFRLIIAPAFWQTWWFRAAIVVAAGFVIYMLVRKRIGNIRKEAAFKQQFIETEMMALRAQMNPHFIFNCLSAIDNLIQTNQQAKATTYLARFARLIRSVLDSTRNNTVPFQKDLESLQLYLQMEQFRCNNRFDYHIAVDDELLHGDYKVPPLIIQPFIENAIHHGLLNKQENDRRLDVSIHLKEDAIFYTVTDNGIGRAAAGHIKALNRPEHISYGIDITKKRIHLYNHNSKPSDVVISDLVREGRPAGTKVEVKIAYPKL